METIHARIKRLRTRAGLSMEALAKACGIASWQTVQQWEGGGKKPTAPSRKRQDAVAAALGVTVEELMHGSPANSPMAMEATAQYTTSPRTAPPQSQEVRNLVAAIEASPPLSETDIKILEELVDRMRRAARHSSRVRMNTINESDKSDNTHRQTSSENMKWLRIPTETGSSSDDEKKSLGGKPEGRE